MAMQPGLNELSKRDELLRQAAEIGRKYALGIGERRVAPAEKDLEKLKEFHEPFPNGPSDPMQILKRLDDVGSPATLATTGGRYFGFVAGGNVGSKRRAAGYVAGGGRARRGGAPLGMRGTRSAGELRRRACNLRDDGEFCCAGGSTSGSSHTGRVERCG